MDDLGTFRKQVNSTKHKLRVINGYGIDKDVVTRLAELECHEIRIKERDTERIYTISFDDFVRGAVERNLGHSPQLFIPVSKMELLGDKIARQQQEKLL